MVAPHSWEVSVAQAYRIQDAWRERVIGEGPSVPVRTVAGVDVAYDTHSRKAWCAIAIFSFPALELIATAQAGLEVSFPYIPGLLAFREGPIIAKAFQNLTIQPDIFLFDGHGLCHPRGFGIASHMGVYLDVVSIGCAKECFRGAYTDPDDNRGNMSPIVDAGRIIGYALRTRKGVKPVFVSIGHKIALEAAVDICLACAPVYRIPEPLRQAHILSRRGLM